MIDLVYIDEDYAPINYKIISKMIDLVYIDEDYAPINYKAPVRAQIPVVVSESDELVYNL